MPVRIKVPITHAAVWSVWIKDMAGVERQFGVGDTLEINGGMLEVTFVAARRETA